MNRGRRKTGQPAEGEAQQLEPIVFEDESEPDPAYSQQSGPLMLPADSSALQAAVRARAEAQRRKKPEQVAPDTVAELQKIIKEATALIKLLQIIHRQDIPITSVEVALTIEGLRKITGISTKAAWLIGLHAVQQEVISQARLADLIQASTATVSRRIHEGVSETDIARPADVRSNPIR
jgi:hypothetical protein